MRLSHEERQTWGRTGVSVGDGGVLVIDGDTNSNKTVQLDKFGWASSSGVLDLTEFVPTGAPALSVNTLHVEDGGQLVLNLEDWIGSLDKDSESGSNILDQDDDVSRVWVVKADSVTGNADSLELFDDEVQIGARGDSTEVKEIHAQSNDPMSEVVAKGHWNYTAGVQNKGANKVYTSPTHSRTLS